MELTRILESYPKNLSKIHRNIPLNLGKKTCVYGARGIGKTEAILNYYTKTKFNTLKKCILT